MAAIFGANEQDVHDVDVDRYIRLANDVLIAERVAEEVEMNILFVDEVAIADLNQRFLEKHGATDVLSFPIDGGERESGRSPDAGGSGPGGVDESDDEISLLGDVVVCPSVAMRNAPDHAGTYEDELALLVVHGALHLLGMNHEDPNEAAAMEERERELLEEFWGDLPNSAWSEFQDIPTDIREP